MARRWLPLLATLLLATAGAALAVLGVRMIGLERTQARTDATARAHRVLEAVGAEVAARDPASLGPALRTARLASPPPAPWSPDAAPPADRLYLAEADFTETRRGDPAAAAAIFARVADATTDPSPLTRAYANLRAGVLWRRLGEPARARARLEAAAQAPEAETPFDEPTARWSVGPAALARRHLVPLDLAEGAESAARARLGSWTADGAPLPGVVLGPPGRLDLGDLLRALAAELDGLPTTSPTLRDEVARRRAAYDAARRDLARLGDRLACAQDGVVLAVTGAPTQERALVAIPAPEVARGFAALAQAGSPGDLGSTTDPRTVPPDAVAVRAAPPLEGLWLWLRPRVEAGRSEAAARTVGAAWGVYLTGAGLALLALRRSARAARMQADFVASVSHEMKTPIASVQAMAEMLADGRVTDPAKARTYAERIQAEMARLGASVRDVLDAARIERDAGAVVRPRFLDPGAVVADVVAVARPGLERRGFALALETRPSAAPLPVDPDALAHVLNNLLDNASKYSGEAREVVVRAGPTERGYRIEVLDRGPGVPAADRTRIFDRFVRGEAARAGAVPGVGLGLHVARELVAAHGGRLFVEDREGGGARFVVEVPEGGP